MTTETIITQLRDRARAYETGSPERESYHVALVRYQYAEDDKRIDKAIMRSWAIQEQRGTLMRPYCGNSWMQDWLREVDQRATSKADAQTQA